MTRPGVHTSLLTAHALLTQLKDDAVAIAHAEQAIAALAHAIRSGSKVLVIGNGGSLCDAAHFVEELTGRFRRDRPALPAIACADPGHITCVGNDYGFEHIFSRFVESLGRPGDILVALSTSGQSPNIVRGLRCARERGLVTIAMVGRGGGECASLADVVVHVPGETSDRIQELHMLLLHIFVEGIERELGYA